MFLLKRKENEMSRESDEILLNYYETGNDSWKDTCGIEIYDQIVKRIEHILYMWSHDDMSKDFKEYAIEYLEKHFGE